MTSIFSSKKLGKDSWHLCDYYQIEKSFAGSSTNSILCLQSNCDIWSECTEREAAKKEGCLGRPLEL